MLPTPTPHFLIEATVTVFGDRSYKEVIKVKCGQKGEALT